MTRSWRPAREAWLLVALWVMTALADLFLRDSALTASASGALQSALAAALLAWPLTIGIAAMSSVRILQRRQREIFLALPAPARRRALISDGIYVATWSSIGLVVAVGITLTIAACHGSWADPRSLLALIPAIIGTIMATAAGTAIGVLLPHWLTPPALAIALYLSYVLPIGIDGMFAYVTAQGWMMSSLVPDPVFLALLTALMIVAVVAFLLVIAATAAERGWRVILALGLACAGFLGVATLGMHRDPYQFTTYASWRCDTIGATERQVCVPRDQTRLLPFSLAQIAPIDARLASAGLAAEFDGYGPYRDGGRFLSIPDPLGEPSDYRARVALQLATDILSCDSRQASDNDAAYEAAIRDSDAFVAWLEPTAVLELPGMPGPAPMTQDEARDYLTVLVQCEG